MKIPVEEQYKFVKLTLPDGSKAEGKSVLLHACCAPCSSAIVECMLRNGMKPTVYFSNSNIYPQQEFDIRKHELMRFLEAQQVPYVEDEYDHEEWLATIRGLEKEPERGSRCSVCFQYRLTHAARYAQEHGFHLLTYSPYAVAKLYGYWIVREYREAYGMFCCSGILFNHESERRGETFVTRKITLAAARIKQGKQERLYLGNLDSKRDWGYAKDYVECMWLILQHKQPEDFVIATGVQHTVREFCYYAFKHVGIELEFTGEGINEKGIDKATGKVLVEVSPDFFRPTDVVNLWGDPTKARAELGWNPEKTSFEELVRIMVESDMAKVAADDAGIKVRCNLAEYLEKGVVK